MLTGHSLGGGVVNILALQVNIIRFNSIAFLSFLKEMLHVSCPLGQGSSAFPLRHHRSSQPTTRSCWREPGRWSTSTSTTRTLCPDSAWPSMRLAFWLYCYQCFYSVAQLLIAHHEVDALQLSRTTKVISPSSPSSSSSSSSSSPSSRPRSPFLKILELFQSWPDGPAQRPQRGGAWKSFTGCSRGKTRRI